MNIKRVPCLALFLRAGDPDDGAIVEVLYQAPKGLHQHPDGEWSKADPDLPVWVCKSMRQNGFSVPTSGGGRMKSTYSDIADRRLRPLDDPGEPEYISETKDIPHEPERTI